MSGGIPAILGALFGAPYLTAVSAVDNAKKTEEPTGQSDREGRVTTPVSGDDVSEKVSAGKKIVDAFKTLLEWVKERKNKYKVALAITLFVTIILLGLIAFVTLFYYLKTQLRLYKDSKKSAEEKLSESEIPYKDHIQYKILNPSVVYAQYKYRMLYYFSAIAFTLVILAFLFKKQLAMDADPAQAAAAKTNADGDDDPIDSLIMWVGIGSVYLFLAFYWFVEKNYYNKIVDLNSKITDFNQYVRSILPANYGFLESVSKDYDDATLDSVLYKPALSAISPKRREIVRAICILNLYTYYFNNKQLYTNTPRGIQNVLSCFSPAQRILPMSQSCFSDYLIHNKSYIPNHIGLYINIINEIGPESAIYKTFNQDRTNILLDVDRVMSQLNERAGCLGSAYAYGLFLKMNSNIFLVVWVPIIIIAIAKGSKYVRQSGSTT